MEMKWLAYGFQKLVAFVDGLKQNTFRPKQSHPEPIFALKKGKLKTNGILSSHNHTFCHSTIVWTDEFGV